jgi:integrase
VLLAGLRRNQPAGGNSLHARESRKDREMTDKTLTPTYPNLLAAVGEIANTHAAAAAFDDYLGRKADNTRRRQRHDLANFAQYLAAVKINRTADELQSNPEAWRGMTWGMVAGYREWMKSQGNAVQVINLRLSTVRVYCKLAMQAGTILPEAFALIKGVNGYSHSEGENLDETRTVKRINTRKTAANLLTPEQIKALKAQPPTPQGRRDAVIIGLLVTLGLRVGECVALTVGTLDRAAGTIRFYRKKVKKWQTLQLINGLDGVLAAYLLNDNAGVTPGTPLLRSSRKGGELTHAGMTRFAIAQRIAQLGRELDIVNLSPHDLRHTWATRAAANKTDAFKLRDAGGWSTMAMPSRYVHAAEIANDGVKLDE